MLIELIHQMFKGEKKRKLLYDTPLKQQQQQQQNDDDNDDDDFNQE